MILLFPIEIGSRELLAKLYLSMCFAEKGYTSYIGYKGQIWSAIPFLKNFVYFDKGYHKGISDKNYARIKKNGGTIISLDEEIGVVQKNNSTLERRFPPTILDEFQMIFLWGKAQYSYLKQRNHFPHNKFCITGHPRFELLQSKYRNLYQSEVDEIKSKYGNYILINTSFGFGNNILGDEFVVSNYISRHPNIQDHINHEQQLIINFINLIRNIRKRFAYDIVLRPHPEESHNKYLEKLADIENFHVEYNGSVVPWIIGSVAMIHHSCTTAVEAVMLGKKAIAYTKDYKEDLVSHIPLQVSEVCNTEEEVFNSIRINEQSTRNEETKNVLMNNFSYPSNSTLNIVESCVDLWPKSESPKSTMINFKLMIHLKIVSMKRIARKLFENFGFKHENILGTQKRKGLDKMNVFRIYSSILQSNFMSREVRIKEVGNQLYKVYK